MMPSCPQTGLIQRALVSLAVQNATASPRSSSSAIRALIVVAKPCIHIKRAGL